MKTVTVAASRSYDVVIAGGLLGQTGQKIREVLPKAQNAVVVTDSTVAGLHMQPLLDSLAQAGFPGALTFDFPAGEASKTGETYMRLLGYLCGCGLSRNDVVIALGGGVVGDLAGFAAATYMRGVPFVQVPTTLLAMVDSSVGGKTGIDLPAGKNQAGAFHQPSLVLCDTDTLRTLPGDVLRDGMAEVIKYAMLDAALLEKLTADTGAGEPGQIIADCVAIKRDIVRRDEFDHGERMLLNFGHTVGHAIESLSGYTLSHGSAVAIGMAVDTRAAVRKNLCPPECLSILTALLERHKLPMTTAHPAADIYRAALSDKKRAGGEITIVVPTAPGCCELKRLPTGELQDWIEMGQKP